MNTELTEIAFIVVITLTGICAVPVNVVPVDKEHVKTALNLLLNNSNLVGRESNIRPKLKTQLSNLLEANGLPQYGIRYRVNRDKDRKMTSIDVLVPKKIELHYHHIVHGVPKMSEIAVHLVPDYEGKISYNQILYQLAPGRKEEDKVYKGTGDNAYSNPISKGTTVDIKDLTELTVIQVNTEKKSSQDSE